MATQTMRASLSFCAPPGGPHKPIVVYLLLVFGPFRSGSPMSGNLPTQHLLFDLDGTLIDGVDDLVISLNVVLAQAGLLPVSRLQVLAMLGDGMRMVVKRAFAAQEITLDEATLEQHTAAFLQAYQNTGYRHTRLFAGVKATLSALHQQGWRIGLASNKFTEPCREILQRLEILPLFAAVAGGDAAGVRKPDPGHLRHTLQLMGFDATRGDRAVMVGDHANDVNAARGAGIAVIAVAFELPAARAEELGADVVLTDFTTLPQALGALLQ